MVSTSTRNVALCIHKVHCVDETGGNWVTERGSDDIYLGGTALSMGGGIPSVIKIPYFKVGGFNDGDKKTYTPPKEFAIFNPSSGFSSYAVTLVLVEKDSGDQMNDFLDELAIQQQQVAFRAYKNATSTGSPQTESSIWDEVIKQAIILAKDLLVDWYKSARKDDIFQPQTVNFMGNTPNQILTFKGHNATYDIHYSLNRS